MNFKSFRIQISTTIFFFFFWQKIVDEPIWKNSCWLFSPQQASNFGSRYLTVISCRRGAHAEGGACSGRRGRCRCCRSFHRSVSCLGGWDGGRTSRGSTHTVLPRGARPVGWKWNKGNAGSTFPTVFGSLRYFYFTHLAEILGKNL